MIVCFVEIGGILDHHCLVFLFIMYELQKFKLPFLYNCFFYSSLVHNLERLFPVNNYCTWIKLLKLVLYVIQAKDYFKEIKRISERRFMR